MTVYIDMDWIMYSVGKFRLHRPMGDIKKLQEMIKSVRDTPGI